MQYMAAARCTYRRVEEERTGVPASQSHFALEKVLAALLVEDMGSHVRLIYGNLFTVLPSRGASSFIR